MVVFNYKARDKDGTIVSGTIEAAERRLAMQRLQARGLSPVILKEEATGASSTLAKLGERVKALRTTVMQKAAMEILVSNKPAKVGLLILKRLMELHGSGLPVGDSIRILSQRLSDKEQRATAQTLWRDLSEVPHWLGLCRAKLAASQAPSAT